MKKRFTRSLSLFLALTLLSACGGGGGGDSARATTMHLRKTEGSVRVSDDKGGDLEVRDDLSLYSGYDLRTRDESYAWVDLDEVKLTKMDQNTRAEIEKDGKDLEIIIREGSLFFHVTEPLADDETMTIRTSTMAVGIRGTCGWVEVPEDEDLAEAISDDAGLDVDDLAAGGARGPVTMLSQGGPGAIKADGTLWLWDEAWGYNNQLAWTLRDRYGMDNAPAMITDSVSQLYFTAPRNYGSDVPDFSGALVKSDGALWVWGDFVGGNVTADMPMYHLDDNVASVSMGYRDIAVVHTDGSLVLYPADYSGIGQPLHVADDVASASLGSGSIVFVKTDGTMWYTYWGSGYDIRQPDFWMEDVAAASLSESTFAALKNDGSLWLWGENEFGQLGNGYQGDEQRTESYYDDSNYNPVTFEFAQGQIQYPYQSTPVKVLDNVVGYSLDPWGAAAVTADGTLWAWGETELNPATDMTVDTVSSSDMSRLRRADIQSVPQRVMDGVAAVSLGNGTLVLKRDGTLLGYDWQSSAMKQVLDQVALP